MVTRSYATNLTYNYHDSLWKLYNLVILQTATYIPQLARASKDSWGVAVCTVDGQRHSVGDVNVPFTIQSCR